MEKAAGRKRAGRVVWKRRADGSQQALSAFFSRTSGVVSAVCFNRSRYSSFFFSCHAGSAERSLRSIGSEFRSKSRVWSPQVVYTSLIRSFMTQKLVCRLSP